MKTVAVMCLVLALLSFGQKAIGDYNRGVEIKEFDKRNNANTGGTFIAVDWSTDYSTRNRNLIVLLCIGAFAISRAVRKRPAACLLSLECYNAYGIARLSVAGDPLG